MNWLAQEPLWRLTAFVGVFSLIAAWEIVAPRRTVQHGKTYRWANNLGILVIDSLLLRLLFPAAAVGIALLAQSRGWGILNQAAVAPHATACTMPMWTSMSPRRCVFTPSKYSCPW